MLTQFELRFDLLYVASDIKQATAWVEHDNPKAVNENMKSKLQRMFKPRDVERFYEIYRYLSGIKHGNPVYSELGFPEAAAAALRFQPAPSTTYSPKHLQTRFQYMRPISSPGQHR